MIKVLLINPPNTIPSDSMRRIGEPLGLLYIGTTLKQLGITVTIFDMACEGYDNCVINGKFLTYGSSSETLLQKLQSQQPNLIGISCMFTSRESDVFRVCQTIRQFSSRIPIVIGGLHATQHPERFLEPGYADYVIFGEGEKRLHQLINCLENNRLPDFDGVAYQDKGSLKINPMTTRIDILDSLPYPDRTLIDFDRYQEINIPFAPFAAEERVGHILVTRGCPYLCNFCSSSKFWGRKIRARSVANVIGEMRELIDTFGVREIQFVDDNFTAKKKFAKELLTEMRKLNIRFCTPNGLFVNSLDSELIKLMAEAGAYQLTFNIESASERVLNKIIQKPVILSRVKPLVEEAHKYDISVHGVFIVGFIGETKEEILSTLNFPFSVGFDSVSFFIATPLPGSKFYQECKDKGYLIENWDHLNFKSVNMNIPSDSIDYCMSSDELEHLVDSKTREYNQWAREKFPERYSRKFSRFLKRHPSKSNLVSGRVT